jgi:hypothetical protein
MITGFGQHAICSISAGHPGPVVFWISERGNNGSGERVEVFIFDFLKGAASLVMFEQARDERGIGDAARAAVLIFADEGLNGLQERRDVQRLLHESIHTKAHGLLVLMRSSSDNDDWDEWPGIVEFGKSGPAVHVWHIKIEKNQVWRILNSVYHGLSAVRRFQDLEALNFEHSSQASAHERVVVND